ncbi:MAG: hypothetical protein K6B13_03605 [Prevotella sp.]|nr:hypothetical protein [Prevotella sp.]
MKLVTSSVSSMMPLMRSAVLSSSCEAWSMAARWINCLQRWNRTSNSSEKATAMMRVMIRPSRSERCCRI